jgi:DNA-binding transcriptional ArsR family regulator
MTVSSSVVWRACRVVACETRLKLLWSLFDEGELSVKQLAELNLMQPAHASVQLKILHVQGLISFRRQGLRVFYRADPCSASGVMADLLTGLRQCFQRDDLIVDVMFQATGLTHQRRVEIVQTLSSAACDVDRLIAQTGIPYPALMRHLDKLVRRGMVEKKSRLYFIGCPTSGFGLTLLSLVAG